MNRDTAQLLAPHAAHLHSLLAAPPALAVILALLALCIAVAIAVRLEGSR